MNGKIDEIKYIVQRFDEYYVQHTTNKELFDYAYDKYFLEIEKIEKTNVFDESEINIIQQQKSLMKSFRKKVFY